MLECPHLAGIRHQLLVNELLEKYEWRYFFSRPFLQFILARVGNDKRDGHILSYQNFVNVYTARARALTRHDVASSLRSRYRNYQPPPDDYEDEFHLTEYNIDLQEELQLVRANPPSSVNQSRHGPAVGSEGT